MIRTFNLEVPAGSCISLMKSALHTVLRRWLPRRVKSVRNSSPFNILCSSFSQTLHPRLHERLERNRTTLTFDLVNRAALVRKLLYYSVSITFGAIHELTFNESASGSHRICFFYDVMEGNVWTHVTSLRTSKYIVRLALLATACFFCFCFFYLSGNQYKPLLVLAPEPAYFR